MAPEKPTKPTLLIVDDEPGPRESLRIVFKDRYHCAIATRGREGIAYARNHPVDAAILDIKMPDLSGVDVLRELKKIDPDTECIMLTGNETLDSARAAVRYGAADYLHKPFDVFFVRELLEKCVARRQHKRAIEQDLQKLQLVNEALSQELTHSNRAVAAGLLSAGVVHEMNNPLSIIAGYAELLRRDLGAPGDVDHGASQLVQRRLTTIDREIDRCKEIATRFLNFSRTRHGGQEIVEVTKLLEDAAALIRAHPANRSADISVSVSNPPLRIKVHAAEIVQVLINLGVNALQAMDGTGTLRLSAQPATALPAKPTFRSTSFDAKRSLVKIAVNDNGCGIASENLEKLFKPYFTTKEQGTGLGLAIVAELVDNYGGLIDVQSTVGQGTTFSAFLPAAS